MTEDELKVAAMRADLVLKTRQARWETPKAVAMVLLAAAAIAAAGRLTDLIWHSAPQQIVVQFQQPLAIKVLP